MKFGDKLPKIICSLMLVTIICVFFVSAIRENVGLIFPQDENSFRKSDIPAWKDAVDSGKSGAAILLAERIVGVDNDEPEVPDPDYIRVANGYEMSSSILTSPLGNYDFLRWQDALAIDKIIRGDLKSSGNPSEILKFLCEKVKYRKTEDGKKMPFTISEIFSRGYGNAHEIARLASELLFNAGFDTAVVSRLTPEGTFLDIIVEARKGEKVISFDPLSGLVMEDVTASQMRSSTGSLHLPGSINLLYDIPSEYQDYRAPDRKLGEALSKDLFHGRIIFGADPRTRIEKYLLHFPDGKINGEITYWRYPFHILRSCPDFPKDWLLPEKTGHTKELPSQ